MKIIKKDSNTFIKGSELYMRNIYPRLLFYKDHKGGYLPEEFYFSSNDFLHNVYKEYYILKLIHNKRV